MEKEERLRCAGRAIVFYEKKEASGLFLTNETFYSGKRISLRISIDELTELDKEELLEDVSDYNYISDYGTYVLREPCENNTSFPGKMTLCTLVKAHPPTSGSEGEQSPDIWYNLIFPGKLDEVSDYVFVEKQS